tara:strand:- start:1613 stop:1903 length:291 start_codon:yes stop_codon:yes gene_type:complete
MDKQKINSLFEKAVNHLNNTHEKTLNVDNNTKLKFYKYYKQATVGNCNTTQPSLLDFKNKAKWEAWNSLKDMSSDKAKCLYITLLQSVDKTFTENC